MSYETIDYSVADGILTLTLDRPEQLNAFTVTMSDELLDAYDRADRDDDVAAIVVTGAGRAFCAGMDLTGEGNVFGLDESMRPTMQDMHENLDDPAIVEGVRDKGGRVVLATFRCTKPVIGAINGPAVGIGATMTLPMDIRLASDRARIGFVFGKLGIVPEATSTWFLPRIVGISRAAEWVYSGRVFDAQEALAAGLVSRVVPPEELLPAAYALAREIAENTSAVSVALSRQMLWRMLGADHPMEAHKIDSKGIYWMGSSPDAAEGVTSFKEKRKPRFSMRASSDMPPYFPWWPERPFK